MNRSALDQPSSVSKAPADTAAPTPRDRRRLRDVLIVAGAALVFAVLTALVRLAWVPLESLDAAVARNLNAIVAPQPAVVRALTTVSSLGSVGFMARLVVPALIVLAVRRRFRLALYLLVATAGALVLDPTLKALIGRIRPVVPNPVAFGGGNSFPSGHALDSLIFYGALVLVFLPALSALGRRILFAVAGTLVVLIGASRVLLGVHFVSDVVGAWAAGIAWLGLTVYAFELFRQQAGRQVTKPLTEGIEPEAADDLHPTGPRPARAAGIGRRTAARLAIGWVVILGPLIGLGYLVVHGPANLLGDRTVPHWLAAHRTPALNSASTFWSDAGNTHAILAVGLVAGAVALGLIRRWRSVVFLVVLMFGELALFLTASLVTGRERPDVPHLDGVLPTSSFPSGHVAATTCLYVGMALLLIARTDGWWRWLALVPAVLFPLVVATARMYRGMHHPTDVLGGLLLAAAWTTVVFLTVRPDRAGTPDDRWTAEDVNDHSPR